MKTDLIYGVEDRPPFKDALFAALQHLLAIFVAIITPPLIIASALKLNVEKTSSGSNSKYIFFGNHNRRPDGNSCQYRVVRVKEEN